MLISISIFTIVTSIVLYSNSGFSNNILITNLAYEIALTLRQAQTYGLSSVKQAGSTSFRVGYGVHFESAPGDNKSFIFFTDLDDNKKYNDTATDPCNSTGNECLQKIIINASNKIESVCVKYPGGSPSDAPDCVGITGVDIVFKRPKTEASIVYTHESNGEGNATSAIIHLISPQGKKKTVTVESSGQISISEGVVSQ